MEKRLKKRSDFLAVFREGVFVRRQSVVVQMCPVSYLTHENIGNPCIFLGFTASKKVGGSVQRNRAKRRLRSLSRACVGKMYQYQSVWPSLEAIPLSKKTQNTACEKNPLTQKINGLAIVFIATKHTPDIQWDVLRTDAEDAMQKCWNRITHKRKESLPSEPCDGDNVVRKPLETVLHKLEVEKKRNKDTALFEHKIDTLVQKMARAYTSR